LKVHFAKEWSAVLMSEKPKPINFLLVILFAGVILATSAMVILPFLTAIFWGATLAVLTYPWYERVRKRHELIRESQAKGIQGKIAKSGDSVAAIWSTLLTLLVICLPIFLVSSIAFGQIGSFVNDAGGSGGFEVMSKLDKIVHPLADRLGVHDFSSEKWWETNGTEITKSLRTPAANLAKQFGTGLFTMVVALLSMFFFQRDGHRLKEPFRVVCGLSAERANGILTKSMQTIQAVFRGTVTVAIIQGTIMGITYAVLGVENAVLLGLFSILLSIVPLLGAPIIYFPVGMVFLLHGDYLKAGIVLGVGGLIVSQIDNVLKPFFIGNQVQLHPLAIFFFALGGISLFGPIGLMVGPVLLSILLVMYDYLLELKGVTSEEVAPEV
jgi:predicted PurR-regulated permease PerM